MCITHRAKSCCTTFHSFLLNIPKYPQRDYQARIRAKNLPSFSSRSFQNTGYCLINESQARMRDWPMKRILHLGSHISIQLRSSVHHSIRNKYFTVRVKIWSLIELLFHPPGYCNFQQKDPKDLTRGARKIARSSPYVRQKQFLLSFPSDETQRVSQNISSEIF